MPLMIVLMTTRRYGRHLHLLVDLPIRQALDRLERPADLAPDVQGRRHALAGRQSPDRCEGGALGPAVLEVVKGAVAHGLAFVVQLARIGDEPHFEVASDYRCRHGPAAQTVAVVVGLAEAEGNAPAT